ncbi:MAG: hypothetical protein ACFFBH_11045 [Promethearchaeota archaeon]
MPEEEAWTHQLDWLNILNILGLKSIRQIPESKKEKALKKLTKLYSVEMLLGLTPEELEELVADQLRDLMKKELASNTKRQEKLEREIKAKAISLKNGGIIPINLNDIKDLDPDMDPEEFLKFLSKRFLNDDDDDNDDDKDKYDDDKNFYYI